MKDKFELDKLWGKKVKEKFNSICPHCGIEPETGQPAHIFGRTVLKTRHVVENGIWACHELHRKMETGEKIKRDVVQFYVDNDLYDNLKKIVDGKNEAKDFDYTDLGEL